MPSCLIAPRRCQCATAKWYVYFALLMRPGSGISGTGETFGGVNGRSVASARWIRVGGGSASPTRRCSITWNGSAAGRV
jgi:hypothetical protein